MVAGLACHDISYAVFFPTNTCRSMPINYILPFPIESPFHNRHVSSSHFLSSSKQNRRMGERIPRIHPHFKLYFFIPSNARNYSISQISINTRELETRVFLDSCSVKGAEKGEETGLRESIHRTIGGIEVPDDEVTTRVPTLWPFCRGQIAPL